LLLSTFLSVMETIAPLSLSESWDNPGLLIEPETSQIESVLVAMDCTMEVVQEAIERKVDLVLTHHPLFFRPVKQIYHSRPDTAAAYKLIRHGIGLYAAHTNLDSVCGGVNDALCERLGVGDVRALLAPDEPLSEQTQSLGRIGTLAEPMELKAFAAHCRDALHAAVRYCGRDDQVIRRVAVLGGAGGDFIVQAKQAGADVLVTGEVKHNQALDARFIGIGVVEAGHYETERPVLEDLISSLQRELNGLQCKLVTYVSTSQYAPLLMP